MECLSLFAYQSNAVRKREQNMLNSIIVENELGDLAQSDRVIINK
jgi:hypothetical protein